MDKKTMSILTGQIKEHFKPGPGRMKFRYVKGEDVIARLNQAFDHEWSSQVEQIMEPGNQVVILLSLTAHGVTHQGFGGADIMVYKDGPRQGKPIDLSNSYKSAFTNALKKAAEQFGVGLMSEDEFTPTETADTPMPVHNAPAAPAAAPVGPVSGSATLSAAPAKTPETELNELLATVDMAKLQKQVQDMMDSSAAPKPESAPAAAPAPTSQSFAKSFKENKPSAGYNPNETRQPEAANPFTPSSPGEETINDIQLNALGGLAKMKKVAPEKAIQLGIPTLKKTKYEELTRDEAKAVIKALNSLEG